jgi:hypothetical protein
LYGCETWSLTSREEHKLRELVKRVLRRIFRPKRDEVMREWIKLHNGELLNLYSSPNIRQIKSRKMKWVGHVACMGQKTKAFDGKVSRTRPLKTPKCRWQDRIKMNLWEIGWESVEWIHLALANTVMNPQVLPPELVSLVS